MGIKYYKLNTNMYEPYWTTNKTIVPYDHIETIVEGIEEYTGGTGWIEINNVNWKDINNIECSGTIDTIPHYIKVDTGGAIYYYYLVDRTSVQSIKDEELYYNGVYALDDYMTIYHHKLSKIIENNPNVLTNRCFSNRAKTLVLDKEYTIDFVTQRYLSNTIPTLNFMSVRQLAYSTTADNLWTLNFPDATVPTNVNFGDLSIPFTTLKETNSRGRYEYIVCKPTSLMNVSNNTLRSCDTKQQFIIIPLISGYQEQILHALNDFDITGTHEKVLDPFGDNQIGLYECDIPFTILVGYAQTSQYGVTTNLIAQPMDSEGKTTLQIPYFTVNNNAPMLFKIVDYTEYENGMYGKFLYFINNITEWTPETEPALWNPTYYKEVYNNGNSNLVSDASRFVFKWTKDEITNVGVQCYLSWNDSLNIAYNYGDLTNSALPTLDNTESVDGNLSLANMYFGSSSANYYANNATTTATNIQVRNSEQTQAWTDAALGVAKTVVNTTLSPSSHILPWRVGMDYARRGTNAAIDISKAMIDTTMQQARANNQFRSSINNLMSSPSPTLSNASTKAVIPNKNGLFDTWAIDIHPNDKKIIFTDYVHNGYPTNEVKAIQDVFNRQFMNILYIDTTYNEDNLRKILWEDEEQFFNTPYWNQQFLAWMNDSHKVYNTWWLINCTDYYSENYISNIENEIPYVPSAKTYIGKYLTTFRTSYPWNSMLDNIKTDNPNAPEDIWNDIEIINSGYNHLVIRTKSTSTKYFGTILQQAVVYNGYIQDSDKNHYFYDLDFLSISSKQAKITCPDGTQYDISTFNLPIVFNETTNITEIPRGFLVKCSAFNQSLTIPSTVTKIGGYFLAFCTSMNSPVTITSTSSLVVDTHFMYRCNNYTSTLTVNGNVTGWKSSATTLSTTSASYPMYTTGVTIAGTGASAIKTLYPNLSAILFRKLI